MSPGRRSRTDAGSLAIRSAGVRGAVRCGRNRADDDLLRCAQLLDLLRRLLPEIDAVCALRTAGLLRRLLCEADAVHQAALLLRPERLLPEAVDLFAALLAGVVQLRGI